MPEDDFSIFYGFGSMHDLRDEPYQPSRLEGLKSVKNTTTLKPAPRHEARAVGFHRPKR